MLSAVVDEVIASTGHIGCNAALSVALVRLVDFNSLPNHPMEMLCASATPAVMVTELAVTLAFCVNHA